MTTEEKPVKTICVYCSSSQNLDHTYVDAAVQVGHLIAKRGHALVYGGTRIGLMGAVSRTAKSEGAAVTGIVPAYIRSKVEDCEDAEALIVTPDMRARKAQMEQLADAFLALPGGFGTLEELMEILTLKQLGLVTKPLVLLNTQGFYQPLLQFFDKMYQERFARRQYEGLYQIADNPSEALETIEALWADQNAVVVSKWG